MAKVEARVLARAPEQTSARFRASVKRAVLRVISPAEETAYVDAVSERRVVAIPTDQGMADGSCYLPADDAATVMAALDAIAYPGCRRRAQYSDLDHVAAYRPGDETAAANLMSLCRRHHRYLDRPSRPAIPKSSTQPAHDDHRRSIRRRLSRRGTRPEPWGRRRQ